MSNIGQSIRNRFPFWSKIRKDSSSDSAILLDSIGKYIEDTRISGYKMERQQEPLYGNPVCEPGNLYIINAFESEKVITLLDEFKKLNFISFLGTRNNEEIFLKEIYNYTALCNVLPTELSIDSNEEISSRLLHLFNEDSLNHKHSSVYDFKIPKKICFNVYDSIEFSPLKDNKTQENKIIISGIDIYGKPVQEYIYLYNEGYYESKNFYIKLKPLNPESKYNLIEAGTIEISGVNAKIEVLQLPVRLGTKEHKNAFSILQEDEISYGNSLKETFLVTKLRQNTDSQNNVYSSIDNIHRFYKNKYDYQNEYSTIESNNFDYLKYSQCLLDSIQGNKIRIEDYCYDYQRNFIATISRDNIIRWYDLKPKSFQTKEFERTKRVTYTIESEKQRVSLNETIKIYSHLERNKGTINNLFIARRKPSSTGGNEEFDFEFLQADKSSWNETLHVFERKTLLNDIKVISTISFDVTFDEYGQYDFYVFSFIASYGSSLVYKLKNNLITNIEFKKGIESALENNLQREVFINSYSVMCEYLDPILELESPIDLSDENNYEIGIFYQNVENTLYITREFNDKCEVYQVKEHKDYFIYDYDNNIAALLEEYDSLILSLENNEQEEITYD